MPFWKLNILMLLLFTFTITFTQSKLCFKHLCLSYGWPGLLNISDNFFVSDICTHRVDHANFGWSFCWSVCCHMVVRMSSYVSDIFFPVKVDQATFGSGHFAGQCCQLVILQQFAPWQAPLTTGHLKSLQIELTSLPCICTLACISMWMLILCNSLVCECWYYLNKWFSSSSSLLG